MMKLFGKIPLKFNIYLLKELSYILLLSLGILTFILVLSRLGKIADLVINKGVGIKDIFFLITFSIPPYLTFTLPMAFLLSVIVVLGRLSTENEVLVLKASGVNLKWLLLPIASLGLVITICGLLNTNFLLPQCSGLFRETLINVIKKGISVDDKEGIFNDNVPGVVIYINKVDTRKRLLTGIVVSDDRDSNIKQTISAQNGYVNIDPDTFDLAFMLQNGSLHRWEKATDTYRNVTFQDYTFTMNLSQMVQTGGVTRKLPYEMDRDELMKSLANTTNQGHRYDLLLEIYKKISLPLASLAFVFLTVPLGVKRKTEGKFSGALYSLLLFVFYYILMAMTDGFGKNVNAPPAIITFLPNVVIAAFGLYLLKNINKEEHVTIYQRMKYVWAYCIEKVK
ncbi:MAG: LptF/LptG family permease [Syntrophorhabdaceae bacterium]|nr:LptF/LptG family permease [Syntrophorhabdaceae bacterium]MDD4194891.1 LptF/LptG family permease [Syntrophorhabdaceae bacterium]